ncbi:MAG: hypothetical protein R3F07_06605 [Opitutaceae bacterium]
MIPAIETETQFPILIVDTASPTTFAGLGVNGGGWSWEEEIRESGIALFTCVERLLRSRPVPIQSIRTVAFCEGPGSILGIRTVAMALRTWMASGFLPAATLMTYSSLALATAGLRRHCADGPLTVAIDARRQSWFCLTSPHPATPASEIRRIPQEQVGGISPPVLLPEGFPIWNPRPESWTNCAYEPRLLESTEVRRQILRPVALPDAYQPESPSYQKWTPPVNRELGPTPSPEHARR